MNMITAVLSLRVYPQQSMLKCACHRVILIPALADVRLLRRVSSGNVTNTFGHIFEEFTGSRCPEVRLPRRY
jgi:hypothetical protein